MAEELRVEPVAAGQLGELLPLIAAYQRFYAVEDIDEERNREFFAPFAAPSERGLLLGAWQGSEPVGFACLRWHPDSLTAREIGLMNDLYVAERARGGGVGRALLEACAAATRERGLTRLNWLTDADNHRAQRLYDSTGAVGEPTVEYDLDLQ